MVQSDLGNHDVFIFISTTSHCLFLQMSLSRHTCGLAERVGYGEKGLQWEPAPRPTSQFPERMSPCLECWSGSGTDKKFYHFYINSRDR